MAYNGMHQNHQPSQPGQGFVQVDSVFGLPKPMTLRLRIERNETRIRMVPGMLSQRPDPDQVELVQRIDDNVASSSDPDSSAERGVTLRTRIVPSILLRPG